MYMQPYI